MFVSVESLPVITRGLNERAVRLVQTQIGASLLPPRAETEPWNYTRMLGDGRPSGSSLAAREQRTAPRAALCRSANSYSVSSPAERGAALLGPIRGAQWPGFLKSSLQRLNTVGRRSKLPLPRRGVASFDTGAAERLADFRFPRNYSLPRSLRTLDAFKASIIAKRKRKQRLGILRYRCWEHYPRVNPSACARFTKARGDRESGGH